MNEKRKNMLSAVLSWAWSQGMAAEVSDVTCDVLIAEKDEHKIAFITEFDRSKEELLESISECESDFIYVVTDDNAKRRKLLKIIPGYCGILCYGNLFGLGFLYLVLKEPEKRSKGAKKI